MDLEQNQQDPDQIDDEEIQKQFHQATEFVRTGGFEASQDQQLQLYGLFKQATIGRCNAPKPGFFSFGADTYKW